MFVSNTLARQISCRARSRFFSSVIPVHYNIYFKKWKIFDYSAEGLEGLQQRQLMHMDRTLTHGSQCYWFWRIFEINLKMNKIRAACS